MLVAHYKRHVSDLKQANVGSSLKVLFFSQCLLLLLPCLPACLPASVTFSHYNGPELRPFCGWYISSFSHARRVIEPSSSLPTNDDKIAFWDDSSSTCQSMWALQG